MSQQVGLDWAGARSLEVSKARERIEAELASIYAKEDGIVAATGIYLLQGGGKRFRPLLVWAGSLLGESSHKVWSVAAVSELLHMATLIHDDVIDEAMYRRGQLAVHRRWGEKVGVLQGDLFFTHALKILDQEGCDTVRSEFIITLSEMVRGEIAQAEQAYRWDVGLEAYYHRIGQKTAAYLRTCARAGALQAHAPIAYAQALGEYGYALGMAFQIVDDCLDFQPQAATGKGPYQDMVAGIYTLPLLLGMEDEGIRHELLKALGAAQWRAAAELVCQRGHVEEALKQAQIWALRANRGLEEIPSGLARDVFESMIAWVLGRQL